MWGMEQNSINHHRLNRIAAPPLDRLFTSNARCWKESTKDQLSTTPTPTPTPSLHRLAIHSVGEAVDLLLHVFKGGEEDGVDDA